MIAAGDPGLLDCSAPKPSFWNGRWSGEEAYATKEPLARWRRLF